MLDKGRLPSCEGRRSTGVVQVVSTVQWVMVWKGTDVVPMVYNVTGRRAVLELHLPLDHVGHEEATYNQE